MSRGAKKEGQKVIRVRARAKGHGHAHGSSAWKIALADFMTAMLALFIVLWATSLDQATKAAIAAYFTNPAGLKQGYSSGVSPISSGQSPSEVKTIPLDAVMREQMKAMEEAGARILERLNSDVALGRIQAQVDVVASRDGLRIELSEAGGGETFFPFGSAAMKPLMRSALEIIASELDALPNPVIVEGHTDAAPFSTGRGYTNWELSSDRAHAARRVLAEAGLGDGRIMEVRGLADTHLRVADSPLDPSNRRITILLPMITSAEGLLKIGVPVRTM
jgi:chemotaxis protein MotB